MNSSAVDFALCPMYRRQQIPHLALRSTLSTRVNQPGSHSQDDRHSVESHDRADVCTDWQIVGELSTQMNSRLAIFAILTDFSLRASERDKHLHTSRLIQLDRDTIAVAVFDLSPRHEAIIVLHKLSSLFDEFSITFGQGPQSCGHVTHTPVCRLCVLSH